MGEGKFQCRAPNENTTKRWCLRSDGLKERTVGVLGFFLGFYWRVVGEVHDLIAAAERVGQRWLKGIGLAKELAKQS